MLVQSLYQTYKRYQTLQTHRITSLPIVILMPHSACNCRCVMCDIWKDNKNLKQLTEDDIRDLLISLKKLGTQQVLMSGGEALLNPNFFQLCELLRHENIKVSLLSTGITLKKNADDLVRWVNDIIVSLDGHEELHDRIRNIPGAFQKLKDGVRVIKDKAKVEDEVKGENDGYGFRISGRTVIHRMNFRHWPDIIESAREIGLDQISFLPADVSSHAFNREVLWNEPRQHEILLEKDELPALKEIVEAIIKNYGELIDTGFIAENRDKLRKIYFYYAAFYEMNPFPYKKCNAPWVSAVVEADGTVRPCFFHAPMGNIRQQSLEEILNKAESVRFRKSLDTNKDDTCVKCVCYLNLSPRTKLS